MVKDFTIIIVTCVIGIVVMTCTALAMGINGTLLLSAFTLVGSIIGYVVKHYETKYRENRGQ